MTIDEAIAEERDNAKTQREIAEECFEEHIFDEKERIEHLRYANEFEQVAEWLKELKEYRAVGTPEECRAALEKQMPKKPIEYEDKFYACPICKNTLMHKWKKYNTELMKKANGLPVCLNCLQAIDWSEEE